VIHASGSAVAIGTGAFRNEFRSEGCEPRRQRHDKGRSFLRLRVLDQDIQGGKSFTRTNCTGMQQKARAAVRAALTVTD
jgi:hypothetical protein